MAYVALKKTRYVANAVCYKEKRVAVTRQKRRATEAMRNYGVSQKQWHVKKYNTLKECHLTEYAKKDNTQSKNLTCG